MLTTSQYPRSTTACKSNQFEIPDLRHPTVAQNWREKHISQAPTDVFSTHTEHKWSVACLLLLLLPRPGRPLPSPSCAHHGAGVLRGAWCVPCCARLVDPTHWIYSAHSVFIAATGASLIAHSQLKCGHHHVTPYFMSAGVTQSQCASLPGLGHPHSLWHVLKVCTLCCHAGVQALSQLCYHGAGVQVPEPLDEPGARRVP